MADPTWADTVAAAAGFTLLDAGADAITERWADGDERFNPDTLERVCRSAVAAWLRGVTGDDHALDGICETGAAERILSPTEDGVHGRLSLGHPVVHAILTSTLGGDLARADLEVWVSATALRYLTDPLTGAVASGSRDGDPEFVGLDFIDTWHLTLDADPEAEWRLASAVTRTQDALLGYPYLRRTETVEELRERTGQPEITAGRSSRPRRFRIYLGWIDHDLKRGGSGTTVSEHPSVPSRQEAKDAVWPAALTEFHRFDPSAEFRPSIRELSAVELLEPADSGDPGLERATASPGSA